jgi:hypothetical protein
MSCIENYYSFFDKKDKQKAAAANLDSHRKTQNAIEVGHRQPQTPIISVQVFLILSLFIFSDAIPLDPAIACQTKQRNS